MEVYKNKAFSKWAARERLSARANVTDKELKALKLYAKTLLNLSKPELSKAVNSGELIEVVSDG